MLGLIRFNQESMDSRFLHPPLFKVSGYSLHTRRNKIYASYVTKKCENIYDPTPDLRTRCHILFEMLSSNLRSNSRDLEYLRYRDLKNR